MATVSRGLPTQPHLDVPKREARALLDLWRARQPEAFERIRQRHPRFEKLEDPALNAAPFKLADAQLVIAREYGFSSWPELKRRIAASDVAEDLRRAIEADDLPATTRLLRAHPDLLHVPLRSGNWGPPMSHAANLGRLKIVEAIAGLGARDLQYAFDRAVLQGQLECARWLHAHGAKLVPGIFMGACETHQASGFRFLLELGAPLTDAGGNRLAPLAATLESYNRSPSGKHEILAMLAQRGYELPDTPTMALHRGDVAKLEAHFRRDPKLLSRHFSLREIYPAECGCRNDGRAGMHWTPIDGTTLLHVAIDFRENKFVEWLLAQGADPNARATIDGEGFGGHTPLFNAVVCGPWPDSFTVPELLKAGADPSLRASVRKFVDWCEEPAWHIAHDVTPTEWARTFPDRNWVTGEAVRLLEA